MVHMGLTAMELCMLTDGSTRQGRLPYTANFYTNMQGYFFFCIFFNASHICLCSKTSKQRG